MQHHIDNMVAHYILPAELVIQDNGILEKRTVIGVFDCIEQAALKRSEEVINIFIVCLEVTDKNSVVQFRKLHEESREIYNQYRQRQP